MLWSLTWNVFALLLGVLIKPLVVVISCLKPTLTEEELDAQSFSMVRIFAFHCKRCNYVWIPKDFEFEHDSTLNNNIVKFGIPKSCARCKSKYWRQQRVNSNLNDRFMAIPPNLREMMPLTPLEKYVKEKVELGRKEGLNDRTIANDIAINARELNFSKYEISQALARNGVKRYISRVTNH